MEEEHPSTSVFREYLKIKSVQPNPDYEAIIKFLTHYADKCGFKHRVTEVTPGHPIIIVTVEGNDLHLPSLLLNSHTDVVPVYPENWKHDPFSATKDDNGDIYARGAQDMKCVGIQYMEAMRELKEEGVKLRRTVHMSFVPDEEIAEDLGMAEWCGSDDFNTQNIGFALDEGIANPGEEMRVFYAEKVGRWGKFTARGSPGHGSAFHKNTAASKLSKIMRKILEFADEQEARLNNNPQLTLGDVNTINITGLKMSGVGCNVVPDHLEVQFDLRMTPLEVEKVTKMINDWCIECDVILTATDVPEKITPTSTDPENKWWKAFSGALTGCGVKFTSEVFPASTDSLYLRMAGIPALGFSPMNKTPVLLHADNEYLNETVFLNGVKILKSVIQALANVQD